MLHDNGDCTPYEGREITGWPVLSMVCGTVVWNDGEFTAPTGHGEFLHRGISSAVATAAA